MFSFEMVTVIAVLIIFALFGIGAYKAEKALAAKSKEIAESRTKLAPEKK